MSAAANYELNPHLFGVAIEDAPEPEPIVPCNLTDIIVDVIGTRKQKRRRTLPNLDRPLLVGEIVDLDYAIKTEFDIFLSAEELNPISVVRDLVRLVLNIVESPESLTEKISGQ